MLDFKAFAETKPTHRKNTASEAMNIRPVLGAVISYVFLNLFYAVILMIVIPISVFVPGPISFLLLLSIPLFPLVSIFIIYKYVYKFSFEVIKLGNFSADNNFSFNMFGQQNYIFKGVLGNSLNKIRISYHMRGEYSGIKFNFYTLGKTTLRGVFTIFEVKLNGNYPHILLDAKENKRLPLDLENQFDSSDDIQLEGNFSEYFRLYSKADPVRTLQVIEPSVMIEMIDNSSMFDIEIVEDRLYILSRLRDNNPKRMETLFKAAESITKNLDKAPL